MTEETRIIIKNKLIKTAKDVFKRKIDRMTYILGARKLLLLLREYDVLDIGIKDSLFDDLDLNKVEL